MQQFFLKKILYYNNNNMNFSHFFLFVFFPFLLGIGVGGERKKSVIRLLGPEQRELLCG